jgi:hypothetical protein
LASPDAKKSTGSKNRSVAPGLIRYSDAVEALSAG